MKEIELILKGGSNIKEDAIERIPENCKNPPFIFCLNYVPFPLLLAALQTVENCIVILAVHLNNSSLVSPEVLTIFLLITGMSGILFNMSDFHKNW